ncbi:MAG: TnsA endonuclease N-terminal domain-containing protein [Pyrinomonadaceae bacterium]
MAKRKRGNNEKQNEKKKKEQRGEGHFDQYKPWLTIQDVASIGLATRLKGTKTGRMHHFLSALELDYFYLLDRSEEVIDIREQYPLHLPETLALAKEINIIHPPCSNPNNPIVVTTDFLITVRHSIGTKEVARTIKYSRDLANSRTLEKFEIERLYWKERNIDWGIVTELDINKTLVKNIKWFYKHLETDSLPISINASMIPELSKYLLSRIRKNEIPLRGCLNFGNDF